MVPCETLPDLLDGSAKAVMQNHIEITESYRRCKERHKALSEWVDKLN